MIVLWTDRIECFASRIETINQGNRVSDAAVVPDAKSRLQAEVLLRIA